MTENEAIEEFKERLELIEKCYRGEVEDYKQTLELGVKALEKQIPKKPIRVGKDTCPKCGTYNETWVKRRNTLPSDIVYCWHCGQAVEIIRE